MKIIFYIFICIAFILVTFFGVGPAIFADGAMSERIVTLVVVLLLYLILGWITIRFIKRNKRKHK